MQDKIQKQILDAFFVVLRPIAKILLRYGIGFREFAEVAKTAFVDVATRDFGIRGRPTNISRVAVMTGLTRKEIRRLRDTLSAQGPIPQAKSTPLAEVLHYWHSDSEFLTPQGNSATLPFAGEKASFTSLVKKYGGDVPPGAMRTELKRVGAVEEDEDGRLTAVKRSFRPEGDHNSLVDSLLHSAYPCLSTIVHNSHPDSEGIRWGLRTAFSQHIRAEDVARIRRISNERIAEFTKSIDDLLMAYESSASESDQNDELKTVAVAAIFFEEQEKDIKSSW